MENTRMPKLTACDLASYGACAVDYDVDGRACADQCGSQRQESNLSKNIISSIQASCLSSLPIFLLCDKPNQKLYLVRISFEFPLYKQLK